MRHFCTALIATILLAQGAHAQSIFESARRGFETGARAGEDRRRAEQEAQLPAQPGVVSTTGDLFNRCSAADRLQVSDFENMSLIQCAIFIQGVITTAQALEAKTFCLNGPIHVQQAAVVFNNWAQAHPQNWNAPPAHGVLTAFSVTYPC